MVSVKANDFKDELDELRQRNAELEAESKRLQLLLNSFGQAIWKADATGRVVEGSPSWKAYTGQTYEELAGFGGLNAVHPDDRKRAEQQWLTAVFTRQNLNAEFRIISPDGTYKWTNVLAAPMRDDQGQIMHWVGINIDINDRKMAEEKSLFQSYLLDNVHNAIAAIDDKDVVTYWNPMAEQLFGWTAGEVIGQPLNNFFKTRLIDTRYNDRQALHKGGDCELEIICYHKDGGEIYANVRPAVINGLNGKYMGIVASFRDITEQKLAEEALRASEEKYRFIAEQLFDGVHLIDFANIKSFYASQPLARISGYSTEELNSFSLAQFADKIHPEDRETSIKHYQQFLDGSTEERDLDLRWQVPGGEYIWLNVRHKLILDSDGNPSIILQIVRDITERKGAGRKQIIIDELRQSDDIKTRFLGIMSHELRNPLASIMMGIEIQKRVDPGSEEAGQARKIIERQGKHLSRLVDDLLDISQIEQETVILRKEPVDLMVLLQQAAADYQQLFAEKSVCFTARLPQEPLLMEADPVRFAQVFDNLLRNALKFTSANDAVSLTVKKDVMTREAVIEIKDTGSGISPELLPHVFQPFVQADQTMDRSSGGLGLGLAIVQNLIELHDGRISIASEGDGKGTLITVCLPLADAVGTSASTQNTEEESSGARPLRILIIDDIPDISDVLSSLLNHLGHETMTAGSGPEGIAKALAENPDVILCDIGLPGMSGYDVARNIRQDQALRDISLIALSGYAQEEDLVRSHAAGFDQHLAKPVSLAKLQKVLAGIGA